MFAVLVMSDSLLNIFGCQPVEQDLTDILTCRCYRLIFSQIYQYQSECFHICADIETLKAEKKACLSSTGWSDL